MAGLDEFAIRHPWGLSPSTELSKIFEGNSSEPFPSCVEVLVIGAGDPRHAIEAVARASKEDAPGLHVAIYEQSAQAQARSALLLAVLSDPQAHANDKVELFLDLYMNARVTERGYENAERLAKAVSRAALGEGGDEETKAVAGLVDFSKLSHRERDELVEQLEGFAKREVRGWDMASSWDWRLRQLLGSRYDFRANLADWDYHMRLKERGTEADSAEFKQWRETGIGYSKRDWTFPRANPTLLTSTEATARERRDRFGKERGRTVAARSYFGDCRDGPFTPFGHSATAEERIGHLVSQFEQGLASKKAAVTLLCGDPERRIFSRREWTERCHVCFLGFDCAGLVRSAVRVIKPSGGILLVERGAFMACLTGHKVAETDEEIDRAASDAGLGKLEGTGVPDSVKAFASE